ncbi:MAG: DUF2892 domain-containing protein [Candidatus Micrarchaeota archaeon]|nr:DUF2892 domain-containing protein [Candidatus Micrarchaeota archaeon]
MAFGEKNIGMADKALRMVLGVVLIGVFLLNYAHDPLLYLLVFAVGLILLATAATESCWLYSLIGFSTLERKKEAKKK